MTHKYIIIFLLGSLFSLTAFAQDDLMDMLNEGQEEPTNYTIATFKASRIINGHSLETHGKGIFQFLIAHRFGRLNAGGLGAKEALRELFGLDNATIRFGLEYGVTDRLTLGMGRSSFEKVYDGFIKYKLLRQSTGKKTMPISMTLFASTAIKTNQWSNPERENFFSARMYYTFQALIARKFSDKLSLQLSPTLIHRNLVATAEDKNDVFVLGAGGRYKMTGSLSLNLEYFWILPNQVVSTLNGEDVKDAFSIGVDIETGGHVFQLHFTNSRGMVEKSFATETTGSWLDRDVHFGFNISRVFTGGGGKKKH